MQIIENNHLNNVLRAFKNKILKNVFSARMTNVTKSHRKNLFAKCNNHHY